MKNYRDRLIEQMLSDMAAIDAAVIEARATGKIDKPADADQACAQMTVAAILYAARLISEEA